MKTIIIIVSACFVLLAGLAHGQTCSLQIRCANDTTLQCSDAIPPITNPVVTSCGTVSIATVIGAFVPSCPPVFSLTSSAGVQTRKWIVTDVSTGEKDSCTQIITIVDTTAPRILSQGRDTTISCGTALLFTAPVVTDACGGVIVFFIGIDSVDGPCGSHISTRRFTRSWVARDVCGNESDTIRQTITLECSCNLCPTASALSVATSGSTINFQLPGSDPEDDPLTYSITQAPSHGIVVLNVQTGAASYTPTPGYFGPDQFKYRVYDGICYSDEATVDVIVARPVPVDIKPGSCPNPLSVTDQGTFSVAVMGTNDFDATQIDPSTVKLIGVSPLRSAIEDVGTPFSPFIGKTNCTDCNKLGKDRKKDMTFKFNVQAVLAALRPVTNGECRVVRLVGSLLDGTPFVGEDVVRMVGSLGRIAGEEETKAPRVLERLPDAFALEQSYPNPFNPTTQIRYALPQPSHVRLVVYDVLGQKVRVLVDEYQPAGYHTVAWDATNETGSAVSSGVYLYRITAGNFTSLKKMVLMR